MGYISKNRHKFYLKCHLIFVCKYRKQLLLSDIRDCVISVFKEVESKCYFGIEIMETDRDHIHLLINYPIDFRYQFLPNGSYDTIHIWYLNHIRSYLSLHATLCSVRHLYPCQPLFLHI